MWSYHKCKDIDATHTHTEIEMQSQHYVKGVSCHRCHDKVTDEQRARFAERERQCQLAEKRGENHIGGEVKHIMNERRDQKVAAIKASQARNKP